MKVPYLRYYPAFYVVPFLLSTVQFEWLASGSEIARWLVMLSGLLVFSDLIISSGQGADRANVIGSHLHGK